MCFVEAVSRRRFLSRSLATGLAATAVGSAVLPGMAVGAERAPKGGGPGSSGVSFRWFGTNGWEITFRDKRILMDPWFGRFPTGFFTGDFDPTTPLVIRDDLIDQHITTADQILVGHGHWDHLTDIPTIAQRTGAMVIGSETHANLLRASGKVAENNIVIVEGGEVMQFDGYTIEVFPSLHSLGATKKFAVPGHLFSVPSAPATVGDLPEGDSLSYLITMDDGFSIFVMSSANFVERAIAGIEPDVALLASIFFTEIHDYTRRLLNAIGRPKLILPTHWDNFERPFSDGPHDLSDVFGQAGSLDFWIEQAKAVSPGSRFVVLDFFESVTP
ncbi:MAG TPA: MBL fold metallo-hydrolase [Pseudonocardiaceae bacterium]|nr:MBL fold metallo-hydrolase [Pseudonocardiaceae bacterium]